MNQMVKTFALGLGLILLLMWVGTFFGPNGMVIGLLFGFIMNFGMYWFSDRIVLAMNGAKPVDEAQAPDLYRSVRRLAERAGLPMPRVYVIPMPTPNAFATGRDPEHAVVAVSPSLVERLSRDELDGVLAHELAHIQHRDILIATLAACVAGAISHAAHMAMWFGMGGHRDNEERGGGGLELIAMMIVAPLGAMLIQMAISRSREFAADARASEITGKPLALANALKAIHAAPKLAPGDLSPATASLFIDNPFSAKGITKWFSTHPPMEDRIAKLEEISNRASGIHS